MTLKQYKAFILSVDLNSISKAAIKLNQTQTTITHSILDLENELGFSLMTRNKAGIKLTKEGKKMYAVIKEVLEKNEEVELQVKKINRENTNTINIGTFSSVACNWLPRIITGFKGLHPEIEIKILDGGYKDILDSLENGKSDIAFISSNIYGNFEKIDLFKDEIMAVVPREYPKNDYISVKDFETNQVISLSEDTDFDSRSVFEENNIKANITYRTKDDYAMISMVENNLGICLEPKLLLENIHNSNKIKILELNPKAYRTISLAIPYENLQNHIINTMKEYITSWINQEITK